MHGTRTSRTADPVKHAANRHVLVLGGLSLSLVNFRGPLIRALIARGHRVTAVAGDRDTGVAATLESWGVEYAVVPLARSGLDPFADLGTLKALVALMRECRPDVFLGYTIKPVTFGLLAARLAGVPQRFAMITGLGYAFTGGRQWRRRLAQVMARLLYRLSLRFAQAVIFQNPDDRAYFLDGLVNSTARTAIVGGSGVDLTHYNPTALPAGAPVFLMVARLLRDKGIVEFVEAARMVRAVHHQAHFVLAGPADPSPDGIALDQVQAWVAEGVIEYRGALEDVRPQIAACSVYVLPSYREGTPRTVLEAMAMGRPIITTDAPGCRETVMPANGLLVPPRDVAALAQAMLCMAAKPRQEQVDMAAASLALAKSRFDVRAVNADILHIMGLD